MTNSPDTITMDEAMQNCPECGTRILADGACPNVADCSEAQDTASRVKPGTAMSAPMAFTIAGNVD